MAPACHEEMFSWTAHGDEGPVKPDVNSSFSKVTTGIQDLEFTVTDVVEGKEYLFRVTACNKCGPGEPAYIDEPVNVSSPASE